MVTLILLSRLGGPDFALNPDLIERAEATPDTVVTLVSGNKYVIRQSIDELVELICLDRAGVLAAAEYLNTAGPLDLSPTFGTAKRPSEPRGHRNTSHGSSGRDSVVSLHLTES